MPRITPRDLTRPALAFTVTGMRVKAATGVPAILVAAGALLLAFALTGCPSKKAKDPTCTGDKDCKDGQVCVDKKCQECATDSQCPDGKKCQDGACVAGSECTRDADCPDGKVCQAGTCQACTGDAECGPGGKCQAGACQRPKACKADEDCADDEDCVDGLCQKPWQQSGAGDAGCALSTVYFTFDDASIQASERERLDANAACLEKTVAKSCYLAGHTDATGTEEYNIALSERSAQSVADYLARLGVDPARLQVVPKGETETSGQGDEKDRRVEFQWR
jgi:peptidoglycan-associated lipoprotein